MNPQEEGQRWPEHFKFRHPQRVGRRDAIEEFLEWLDEHGYVLAKKDQYDADYVPIPTHEEIYLVVESLGLDPVKYREEEADMIRYATDYFKNRT
jgi:hypothetical protein